MGCDTHNFGELPTFTKLLNSIRVLHIIHGDSVDHNDSVIFPKEMRYQEQTDSEVFMEQAV